MSFKIGQVFRAMYPPEAAVWCMKNNAYMAQTSEGWTIEANAQQPLTYSEKRSAEYPPIGDQLDAILKCFWHLQDQGYDLPTELTNIMYDWMNVKNKYPKEESDESKAG